MLISVLEDYIELCLRMRLYKAMLSEALCY